MGWLGDHDDDFIERINRNRAARFAKIDSMSPELRGLVNDYGFTVVHTLQSLGVTKPNQIRHVVEAILDQFSPTRGSFSQQGIRTEVMTSPTLIAQDNGGE